MISESLNLEIWDRFFQKIPLDGLPLAIKEGRLDLRGLSLPEPDIIRRYKFADNAVTEITPAAVLQNVKWHNLDFTGSKLKGMRFFDGEVKNCRFDKCDLEGLRVWTTNFVDCSFKGANLKNSALGGVKDGKRNTYTGIDFSEADLRGTGYKATAFERCQFCNAKLVKIDFQSSTFVDCRFEGELSDVLFYNRGFEGEGFPLNEMVNVDFSMAKLHDVAFRCLVLDRVQFPNDEDHILIRNFTATLDKVIAILQQQNDPVSKKLIAILNIDRKWLLPNRSQGVINARDLEEVVGVDGVRRLRQLLS